ncbi:MAG TPA: hypothetical protein VLE44_01010 [Candidatus Saccharimonadales bacterium]|nr:hypothetical protein [Candidatus Saccharimonadales bacterium]
MAKKVEKVSNLVEIRTKKKELTLIMARMHSGREKNLKKAKFLRKEIARLFTVAK